MSDTANGTPNTGKFSDLKAVFFNGTLKKSPETSNTQGLIEISRRLMERQGVATRVIRT
ncbi:flavodoxin family protein, partial [Arthrobacter sp. 2YAF22_2]